MTTTTQTPVDALMALVDEHGRKRAEHSAHVCHRNIVSQQLQMEIEASRAEIEASVRALAAIPADRLQQECDTIAELNHAQWLALGKASLLVAACNRLSAESEEFDFDDGMGRGVQQAYWDEFESALEQATEAINESIVYVGRQVKNCEWTNCPHRVGDVCCNDQPAAPTPPTAPAQDAPPSTWDEYALAEARDAQGFAILYGDQVVELRARIEADEALMRTAVHLLKRYVSETPLGNQPHMITMEADAAITALRKRLESSK